MKIALAVALLTCGTANGQVLEQGSAAYGDWHTDAPGVVRHLTEADLPAPGATPSASRGPRVIPRPAFASPAVPKGFTVQLWATGLNMPRTLRTAPNGDVFLAESGSGRVLVWRPQSDAVHPDMSRSGVPVTFASRLDQPFGIAFWPPTRPRFVYVAETSRVVRYPYDGRMEAAGPAEVIIPHLPEGGHWTRDLAVAQDGASLFVSVGSSSNIARGMLGEADSRSAATSGAATGDEAGRGAVFRFSPQGGPLALVASGIRNCVGLAIEPKTGALWCSANERDGLGDDLPPDYVTHVAPGAFYGWPWYYIGAHEDPRHKGERPDLKAQVTVPDVLIQPHSAPLGLAFYNGHSFPPEYEGDGFMALHGSWNRAKRTGYKIVRIKMHDGVPTGEYEDFMTGFVSSDEAVWGRPVGVTATNDGSLLVSEDGNGTIWRVSYGVR